MSCIWVNMVCQLWYTPYKAVAFTGNVERWICTLHKRDECQNAAIAHITCRSLKLVTAHVLLTTETHFKNSKLWCGCILFISSSRYYHRYIFNMLHAMFFLHIFYYIHKFCIALFNTLCILFAVEFLPSLTCFKPKF